jgi:hypothetical protein
MAETRMAAAEVIEKRWTASRGHFATPSIRHRMRSATDVTALSSDGASSLNAHSKRAALPMMEVRLEPGPVRRTLHHALKDQRKA